MRGDKFVVPDGPHWWLLQALVDNCPTCGTPIAGIEIVPHWQLGTDANGLQVWVEAKKEARALPCDHPIIVAQHFRILAAPADDKDGIFA